MVVFSIDEDRLPHCHIHNVRTIMVDDSRINEGITVEKCPLCEQVFKFVVESDEDIEEIQA